MKIKPDCIPCILKMAITSIRNMELDEESIKQLYSEILKIPHFTGIDWEVTSADVIELVMEKIIRFVQKEDPFFHHKMELNKQVMELYPFLEELIAAQPDPLNAAVKLAIMGNAIDVMMPDENKISKNLIERNLKVVLSESQYAEFKNRLKKSRLLLYFGDNAGEMVFDKLLLEAIKKQKDIEVVFVVRNGPTLNDATMHEAQIVGMGKVAPVVKNGINGHLPSTILKRCSKEVQDLVDRADMIISKGGGNFDTLDEENAEIKKKITFMLLSNCYPYYKYFGIDIYQPVLFHPPSETR